MRRRLLIGAMCAVTVGTGACATTSSAPSTTPALGRAARDVILASELEEANATDGLQAVQRLRPEFLQRQRQRGPTSILAQEQTQLVVYQDNVRMGPVATLRDIPARAIRSIRYLTAAQAAARFGVNHQGGVILVTTLVGVVQ